MKEKTLERMILQGRQSGRRDSNPRQPAWEAGTLPAELLPHFLVAHQYTLRLVRCPGGADRVRAQDSAGQRGGRARKAHAALLAPCTAR